MITKRGSVQCWGRNEFGQLGNGNSSADELQQEPARVANLDGSTPAKTAVQMLGKGGYHNCALTATKAVMCWGYQFAGQLGDGVGGGGGTPRRPTAQAVRGFDGSTPDKSAAFVATGEYTTCAIKLTGALFCWGDNRFGKSGTGGGEFANLPAPVPGFDGTTPERSASMVSIGNWMGCAVSEIGAVWCWGSNSNYQSGDGTNTSPRSTPVLSKSIDGTSAERTAIAVSAGNATACAVMKNGSVKCWGNAANGAFGNTKYTGPVADATAVSGIDGSTLATRAVSVATSSSNSCALMADSSVKCWGYSDRGQAGTTGSNRVVAPPFMPSDLDGKEADHAAVSIGVSGYHTCALLKNGNAYCMGGTGATKESTQQKPQNLEHEDD